MRLDGRADGASRELHLTVGGANSQAAGSAYVELGAARVLVSVYGPREAAGPLAGAAGGGGVEEDASGGGAGTLLCSVQLAPSAMRVRRARGGALVPRGAGPSGGSAAGGGGGGGGGSGSGQPSDEERRLSRALEHSLAPAVLLARFPRAVVEVHCLVLEAGGVGELDRGAEVAAIVGASLALADAGIEMLDLCAAASVAGVRPAAGAALGEDGAAPARLLVDPTAAELGLEAEGEASAGADAGAGAGAGTGAGGTGAGAGAGAGALLFSTSLSMLCSRGVLTHTQHEGEAGDGDLLAALRLGMEACAATARAMREALLRAHARKLRRATAAAAAALADSAAAAEVVPAL